ncbi:MAG: fibronectin type III domain-containing protein [Paludibacteraceae bacterium]|nr:fibronectin type III domain-containing protein [Paludibacteraceae bacterium]
MRKSLMTFALTLALLLVSVGIKAQTGTVYLDIDFEDCTTGAGNIPAGWNNQDYVPSTSSITNSYLWYVATSSTAGFSHSGTKYAILNASNSYTLASRLKTPAMSLSSTKPAKVSFWLRNYKSTSASYQNGDFSLYVSTDGGATYLQNPLVQHRPWNQEWEMLEYSLDAFKGETITLVFEGASSGSTSAYAYYYLDDIRVEEAPTCQAPKDAYVNNLTGTSATLNWDLDTRYGVAPAQYSVTLKDVNDNVLYYNAAELASGVNFTGLQPNTTYVASVRSDCSAAYQGFSDSVFVTFNTLPNAVNPPFYEDFDGMADFVNGYYYKNAEINSTATYSYGNAGNSVKLTTTASDDAYIIFPLMNIAANNIEVDFMMRRAAAATATIKAIPYQVGYLTDPSDVSSTFVPVLQDNIDGDVTWRNIRFNTASVPDVTTPVMVCLNISAAYATSVYVDEVSIHVIPTCTRPEHVTCSNITDQTVTVSWDMANATSCVVRAMSLTDSTVISQVATQNPYTFTGLTPNTEYEITVQGACSATDSSEVTRPVTAKTECSVAESAIFLENFDNLGTQPIPDCWKMDWIVKPSNNTKTAPFATGTTKHSGTKGMSLVDQQAGSISYLSTGALPFDVAGKYNFSIWVNRATYSTMKNNEGIQIWITNAPGDTVGGTMLAYIHREPSLTPVDNAGWHQYEYNIPVQGNKYVTIVGISEYGAATWFDDVEVMLAPSCLKVTGISLADVAATSADVAWTAGKDETQWIVNYTLKMGSAIVLDSTFVADTAAFSVEGLTPATNYTVMGSVRALCGVGDTAEAVSFSFPVKTQCLPMAQLPYTIDFENEATGTSAALPECWNRFNDASGTINYYPYVFSSTTYFHSGSKGLYFYTSTTTTYAEHQAMILPAIDVTAHPINTLRIKFWAKRNTSTSYADAPMIIGVMSNPTDLNSFVAVDTVVVSNTADQQEYIVQFDKYVGNGANIAIRLDRQSSTCYCYVDDITVEPIPNCLDLEGSATVSDNTESSVKITIDDQTATTGWSFAYGLAGTHVTEMTTVDTTGAFVVLNNLASATAYDLYVRRNCGNGDYSPWSAVISFLTTAVPATIPYICGFEDATENGQWQFSQGNAANNFAVGSVATAVHNGTQSIYVSQDNGETNTYAISPSSRNYAYRTINFGAKGYQIEYYWRCPGGEGTTTIYDYGRVMLLPVNEAIVGGAGTNITSSNQQAGFPTNAIMLNPEVKGYMSLDGTEWHFESFFVNMTATPGNYNLVLAWNNDGSGPTSAAAPLAIDDITITELTCIPPVSIQTSAISATSATLSVNQATASEWEFIVDTIAFTKDAVPAAPFARINSTDGSATLTNLIPNTEYFYSVRTICGEGDTSAWLAPASLRTFCSAYDVPYTEGFENVGAAYCWSMMADQSGEASVERATTYHKSGTASLKGVKASIISPEFNVDSLTHYMINGWVYSTTDSAQFGVGVIVDPNDASTYERISEVLIPTKNTWTEFTAYFTALADPDYEDFKYANNIVFACGGENTLYFDDILVDLTPTCPKPNEVAITNITAHSFDISFTDNASASQWVVYTNGTPNVITTNPATISNLSASMNYTVSIAAVCSATDTSYVTDCGTIRTLCDKLSTPWVCGFESTEGYVGATSYNAETTAANFENNCWTVFNQKPGGATYPYAYVSTTSTYVHSGVQGVYTYTSSAATKNLYMMLPDLTDPSNKLRINVWYKNGSTTTTYSDLEFGYWTDPTADTSFVTVYTFPKSSTWTEGEIMTNNASYNIPANARIGFMIDRNSTGYGLYLDDISVNLIRSCSDPETPTVSDITSNAATVSFADTCRTHTAWEYVYGPTGFDPNTATPVSIDTTVFTLTGLTDDSNYDVYVRAVCGVGDVSNYVPATFKTLCLPFHVTATNPFFEDFNNYNYGQFMHDGTCYTILGENLAQSNSYWAKAYPASEPSATATTFYFYGHSADRYDRSLYWYLYKTYISNGTFLRQFHLDAGTTYEMSAWVRNSTTTSYSTLVSAMMGVTADDLDTLSSLVVDGETKSSRSIDGHTTYPYNELYKEIKAFITPDSTGDYYIGFNAAINNTSSYTYLYFDDWSIKTFTGVAPTIPNIDSVTTNAAYVSVNDTDYYQFEYVLNDTTLPTTVVDTNVFVINGLSASTSYTLYMRKYGDATTYSEWVAVSFKTLCGIRTEYPYVDGFESYRAASTYKTELDDNCWLTGSTSTSAYHYVTTTSSYLHSGSKALYIYNYSSVNVQTFALPKVDTLAGKTLTVWYKNYNSTSYSNLAVLELGYLTNPDDVNSFVLLETAPFNSSAYSEIYVDYMSSVPVGARPAFRANGTYYMYIDDVTLDYTPSCRDPKNAPVFVSSTMTTATVSVDMNEKPMAEIAWFLPSNTDSIIGYVTTNNGNAIATGLSGNTTYGFKYRFICSVGDTSAWSPIARGTTMASDCFAPQNVRTVGTVNDHHAAITWGKAPEAVAYEYILKQGNNVVDSAVNLNDTIVYDTLAANTIYVFKVRTLCADDTSAWITLNIQTAYPTFTLPFICGFEDATQNNGWQMQKFSSTGSNEFIIGNAKKMAGNNALYVSDDNSSYHYNLTGICLSDAEVLIEIPAGNYYVSYDWTCDGEGTTTIYDYGRLFLAPSSTNVSTGTYTTYRTTLPAGAISLDDNAPLLKHTDWTNHSEIVTIPNDGVYKLVALWANDGTTGTTDPIAFDNIRIEEVSCMPVSNVNMVTVNPNFAEAVVTPYADSVAVEYALSTYSIEDSVETWTVATSDTLSFPNLGTGTDYYLFVRHACSATDKSPVKMVMFSTPNNAMLLPFVATFEANDTTVNHWILTTGCDNNFVIGNGVSNTGSRSLYISDGSGYSYSGGLSWSYAYIPLQFSAGSYDVSYQWQCLGESTFDYGHVFLAPSSMVPQGGVQLGNMAAAVIPTGAIALDADYGKLNLGDEGEWKDAAAEVAIPNAGTYNLIVAWHNDASVYHTPPLAIDNIRIKELTCPRPDINDMSIDSSSTDMIRLKISGMTPGKGIIYHVASDNSYADTIASGVVYDSLVTLTGLSASTRYYARVSYVCSEGDTSSVLSIYFRTNCGVTNQFPYTEDFESYVASSTEKTQLDDNCWLTNSTSTSAYYYITTTASYVHSGSKALYIYNYSSSNTYTFAMPKVDTLAGKRLSMWYKNYGTTATYAKLEVGYLTNPDNTNSFVLLSTAPLTSAYTEYVVNYPANVPVGARPAFRANGTYYMYVDDIRLNKMVQGPAYEETLCFGQGYNDHGFACPPGSLAPGDTILRTVVPALVVGTPDTAMTVTLHVLPEIVTEFYDTICAGQPYNKGLFNIPADQTHLGYYHVPFPGASSTGCDSTVSLYLHVLPTSETINDTICQGDVYPFDGQNLTQTGTYVAYTVNSLGCNDTVTLNLFVVDSVITTNAAICQGESYEFEGNYYTQQGVYRIATTGAFGCNVIKELNLTVYDTDSTITVSFCKGGSVLVVDTTIDIAGTYTLVRVNATGCDVTYHITATENDIVPVDVHDVACEGYTYTGYGISNLNVTADTVVVLTGKTIDARCDSITNVHLRFVATAYVDTFAEVHGESFTWHYNTYTESGEYLDTVPSSLGCDSIVTLHLTLHGDGLESVADVNMSIVPNPVNAGATAFVYGEFGEVERVEILSNFGQVVETFVPDTYPIEVSGISASGLYYVRVTTKSGSVHIQKLIVK